MFNSCVLLNYCVTLERKIPLTIYPVISIMSILITCCLQVAEVGEFEASKEKLLDYARRCYKTMDEQTHAKVQTLKKTHKLLPISYRFRNWASTKMMIPRWLIYSVSFFFLPNLYTLWMLLFFLDAVSCGIFLLFSLLGVIPIWVLIWYMLSLYILNSDALMLRSFEAFTKLSWLYKAVTHLCGMFCFDQ